ncbi:hypothetical protein DM860_008537 [Cuscuta australis]|uniref:Uncharacterized protein n=1 Tax=Cuscuta australis TaxID=267555 RepID=A0A328D992_9ASTE|nr:hypothetical protein DM860_008537 [Cuscuta australis]
MKCSSLRIGLSIVILIVMDGIAALLGYQAELAQDKGPVAGRSIPSLHWGKGEPKTWNQVWGLSPWLSKMGSIYLLCSLNYFPIVLLPKS